MFATGLCFASIVSTVSSLFEGQSIAILPFEPVFFFKSLAQRGLTLAKPNDCSFFFLVSFCNLPIDLRQISYKSVGRARDFLQLSTGKLKSAVNPLKL